MKKKKKITGHISPEACNFLPDKIYRRMKFLLDACNFLPAKIYRRMVGYRLTNQIAEIFWPTIYNILQIFFFRISKFFFIEISNFYSFFFLNYRISHFQFLYRFFFFFFLEFQIFIFFYIEFFFLLDLWIKKKKN